MTKSDRFKRMLAWVCLAGGAFALPLSADEITVTVPPDSPPQQGAATPAPALPTFSSGDNLNSGNAAPAAPAGSAANDQAPSTASPTKPKVQKPAAAAASTTAPDKTKQAKVSPCKGLDETTCGGNKLCSWTAPTTTTPDAAGKVAKAHCRSLASLKKEASKAAKAGKPEVLPWAASATTASTTNAAPASDAAPKPATVKKTKTASVKKKPKAEVAPPVPAASDNTQEAPPAGNSPAPDPQ